MNETIVSTVIATVIAAGVLSLLSFVWKHRGRVKDTWHARLGNRQPKTETVSFTAYTQNFQQWESETPLRLKVKQYHGGDAITYEGVIHITLLRNPTGCHALRFRYQDRQEKLVFVNSDELTNILKKLYYREVSNG